jgi:hypothetical protein
VANLVSKLVEPSYDEICPLPAIVFSAGFTAFTTVTLNYNETFIN